jgi:predicted deacetylase
MSPTQPNESTRTIAVALHGIEPATFERCALMRDWLSDHGIDRVTLLVIPARDLHPVGERAPEMVLWLNERRSAGDSLAQHGFQHVCRRRVGTRRRILARANPQRSGEFVGLDSAETRAAVSAGWRVLKIAGIEPDGFVAPSYAYTPALRETLQRRFRWWASLLRVHDIATGVPRAREPLLPAFSLFSGGPLGRVFSPPLARLAAVLPSQNLRLDLHPADLRHPRHMMALERVLQHAHGRIPITYAELAGVELQPFATNSAGGSDWTPEPAA